MDKPRRSIRLNFEASEAYKSLPRWVNRTRFLSMVLFGDTSAPVHLSPSTATICGHASVQRNSDKVIQAVKTIESIPLYVPASSQESYAATATATAPATAPAKQHEHR